MANALYFHQKIALIANSADTGLFILLPATSPPHYLLPYLNSLFIFYSPTTFSTSSSSLCSLPSPPLYFSYSFFSSSNFSATFSSSLFSPLTSLLPSAPPLPSPLPCPPHYLISLSFTSTLPSFFSTPFSNLGIGEWRRRYIVG